MDNITDDIVLQIYISIPNNWMYEERLKRINKQWKRVIDIYNLNYTSWINIDNKTRLTIFF